MRAGKLNRVIDIERAVVTVDTFGTPVETWKWVTSLRAQLVEETAEETMRSHGSATETLLVFRTRFYDLTLAERIVYGGRPYDLKKIKELGRRQGMELHAAAAGAP